MNLHARSVWVAVFVLLLSVSATGISVAKEGDYPQKPLNLLCFGAPGGANDVFWRSLANVVDKYLGQTFVVVNKTGAAGLLVGDALTKAKPDGYTIGDFQPTSADPELYKHFRPPSYKFEDLTPVIRCIDFTYCLISRNGAPWRDFNEFVAHVKKNPKQVTWGHLGVGHTYHLFGVGVFGKNELDLLDVPFKSSVDVNMAILGKKIDVGFVSVTTCKSFVEAGQIQMLAVNSQNRMSYLANIPTFAEFNQDPGFPRNFGAIFAPKKTPVPLVKKIHDSFKKGVEDPAFKAAIKKVGGMEIYYGSEEDIRQEVYLGRKMYGEIFKRLGFI